VVRSILARAFKAVGLPSTAVSCCHRACGEFRLCGAGATTGVKEQPAMLRMAGNRRRRRKGVLEAAFLPIGDHSFPCLSMAQLFNLFLEWLVFRRKLQRPPVSIQGLFDLAGLLEGVAEMFSNGWIIGDP